MVVVEVRWAKVKIPHWTRSDMGTGLRVWAGGDLPANGCSWILAIFASTAKARQLWDRVTVRSRSTDVGRLF